MTYLRQKTYLYLLLASYFLLLTSYLSPLITSGTDMAYAQETPAPVDRPESLSLLEEGIRLFNSGRFNEAIKTFQEFSQLSPDNYLPYYYIGFSHFRLGDKASAKEALQKAVELKPDFAPAHMGLAAIYEGEGRLDLAKKEYEMILSTEKEPGEVKIARDRLNRINTILSTKHIQEAQRLVDEGKIEEAVRELSLAMEITPENIAIHMSLGSLYMRLRKPGEAIEAYKRAKGIAPGNPDIHMHLAALYHSMASYKEAIEEFGEVIRLTPGTELSESASKKLKEAEDRLKMRGSFEEAARALREERLDDSLTATQKIIEAEPANSFAYFNLGVIYTRKKMYDEAVAALKRAIEISPKYVEAHYQMGVAYDDQGRFEEAILSYETAAAIGKEDVEETRKASVRLRVLKELIMTKEASERVRVLMNAGDMEGALREAEKLVAVTKNEKNLLALGQVYLSRKEFDRAIEAFDRIIKINPRNWDAYLYMAQAYEGKRLFREAMTFYSKVVNAEPDTKAGREAKLMLDRLQIKIHFENAGEYKKKGDVEGALRETQMLLELTPDDPIALYNAGVLYYMFEMPDRALSLLIKAIERAPDYATAHLQLAFVYEHLRRYTEAEAEFNAVLSLVKEGKEADIAKSRLGLLKKEGAFSIRMRKAQELIQQGKYEEALDEAEVIITIAPENYVAHYTIGFVYEKLNMIEEAKTAFLKSIEVNPSYARVHFGLARVYEKEGLYEEAREAYKKTISTGEGTREAEVAAISLERLKKWRLQASMNNTVNDVIPSKGERNTSTASGQGISLSYDLYKTKGEGLNINSIINHNIYYERQVTARGHGVNIKWNDELRKNHTYGVSAGYTYYTFDKKPNYKNYKYSLNTTLSPDAIPASLSLRFDYTDITSFINKLRDTAQYTLSLSVSQNTSKWDSVTGSYSFVSYLNKDPIGNNFAYRSNDLSVGYNRRLWSAFSMGSEYNVRLTNYMNPDSTTLFTEFRRNLFQGISINVSYRLADKGSLSLKCDISQETTNIPSLKGEDLVEIEERLANPIPRVGGWDRSRTIGISGNLNYLLSERVYLSLNAGNTWGATVPEEAGGYRSLSIGISLSTVY